jgi:CHAT domain-containing protein
MPEPLSAPRDAPWKLVQTYISFGREDLAISIINDILEHSNSDEEASSRSDAFDCLQIFFAHLLKEQVRFAELPPYIHDFVRLFQINRANITPESGLINLIHAILDQMADIISSRDERILRNFAIKYPMNDAPETGSLTLDIIEGYGLSARIAEMLTRYNHLAARQSSKTLALEAESQLRALESELKAADIIAIDPYRTVISEANRRQLQRLLHFSLFREALPRTIQLYREPSMLRLFDDQVTGATLYLTLTRLLLSEGDRATSDFYNLKPTKEVRKYVYETLLAGPLDNQFFPFLARNLERARGLVSEMLELLTLRSATSSSAAALILIFASLLSDRMATKVSELDREGRRSGAEITVMMSEYDKMLFPAQARDTSIDLPIRSDRRSVAYRSMSLRVVDYPKHSWLQPRRLIHQIRSLTEPGECVISLYLGRVSLWATLITRNQAPFVMRIAASHEAAEIIESYRADIQSGAIRLWSRHDFAEFDRLLFRPLEPELQRRTAEHITVVGSQSLLPLHAGWNSDNGSFAIERYTFSYEPSAQSIIGRAYRAKESIWRDLRLLAIGHSTAELPFVKREFQSMRALLGSRMINTRLISNSRVARKRLREGGYSCVHLAGHMSDPVVAGGWLLSLRDQELNCLAALHPVSHQTRLVVAMTCSAGSSIRRWRSLEGGLGLALKSLGLGCIIAPTHPIPDQLAAEFSIAFYSSILEFRTVPQAFQEAVKTLLATWEPAYWSAFTTLGD